MILKTGKEPGNSDSFYDTTGRKGLLPPARVLAIFGFCEMIGKMKTLRYSLLAFFPLLLMGCASNGETAYRPKPPYLLNALADASDAIADNTDGFIAWRARTNATVFRALTPGFWLDRKYRDRDEESDFAELAQSDKQVLIHNL